MLTIIFDKSGDSDPTNVGKVSLSPKAVAAGVTLEDEGARLFGGSVAWAVVDDSTIPVDDSHFRAAWDYGNDTVDFNMVKAIAIAHDRRRAKREVDFAPHDEVIAKQLPGSDAVAAEAARQAIRDADAITQTNIDAATTEAELRAELSAKGIL